MKPTIEIHCYEHQNRWYWVLHTPLKRKAKISSCDNLSETNCRLRIAYRQEDGVLPSCEIVVINPSGQEPREKDEEGQYIERPICNECRRNN